MGGRHTLPGEFFGLLLSIPGEDLKRRILEVFAANGLHGMNAKQIAD